MILSSYYKYKTQHNSNSNQCVVVLFDDCFQIRSDFSILHKTTISVNVCTPPPHDFPLITSTETLPSAFRATISYLIYFFLFSFPLCLAEIVEITTEMTDREGHSGQVAKATLNKHNIGFSIDNATL